MEYQIKEMQQIQRNLLQYLAAERNVEENYQNLIQLFYEYNILCNHSKLKSFFHLLNYATKNINREIDFFHKIEQILSNCKNSIKNFLANSEIFQIFKNNKAILYYLIQNKILIFDEDMAKLITTKKYTASNYHQFFKPDIKPFIDQIQKQNEIIYNYIEQEHEQIYDVCNYEHLLFDIVNPDDAKRKIGENDHFICHIIRKDLIKDFIIYVKKNNISLNSFINSSIYETNSFLLLRKSTFIEYATFFGSIHVFKYLYKNDVPLTKSLWLYAIHGNHQEIIQILEDQHFQLNNTDVYDLLKESIKCHHNDIAYYIINNFLNNGVESYNCEHSFNNNIISFSFQYYNYEFIPENLGNRFIFFYACKYDYYDLVKYLIETRKIDLDDCII